MRTEGPCAFVCVRFVFVREGSADVFGEFGRRSVDAGDVLLIGPSVLCGATPDRLMRLDVVDIDTDYAIDQVFWQYAVLLCDRYDAAEVAASIFPEPFQVMRLTATQFAQVVPWLDELGLLSGSGGHAESFNKMQALWFAIADVLSLHLRVAPIELAAPGRQAFRVALPARRRFAPIRADAQAAAYLLRHDPARHWTLNDLASEVHLSRSHLGAVFAAAFGKPPMAI